MVPSSVGAGDSRRERIWIDRYSELLQHVARVGRMPREGADEAEESLLAGWVRYQRRRENRKELLFWQRELLDRVSGFSWDPLGEQWEETCRQLERFFIAERRIPRYRTSEETERALAAWVHKQRHLYARGELAAHRIEALRKLPFQIV